MKKILTLILVLFLYPNITFADRTTNESLIKDVPMKEQRDKNPIKDHPGGPRVPARVPLSCFLMDNCLTVICEYEANMEITVTNNATGEIVAHEISDLTTSLSLYISDYTSGAMEVTIEMEGKTFVGYF